MCFSTPADMAFTGPPWSAISDGPSTGSLRPAIQQAGLHYPHWAHTGTCSEKPASTILSCQGPQNFCTNVSRRPTKPLAQLVEGDPDCGNPILSCDFNASFTLLAMSLDICLMSICPCYLLSKTQVTYPLVTIALLAHT